MKNWTILLFSGSFSKICCTKLDLLQDIRKFYGALFDVHRFLKYERRHQSVAFNSLATQWVRTQFSFTYTELQSFIEIRAEPIHVFVYQSDIHVFAYRSNIRCWVLKSADLRFWSDMVHPVSKSFVNQKL